MPSQISSTLEPDAQAKIMSDDDAEDGSSEPPGQAVSAAHVELNPLLEGAARDAIDWLALLAGIQTLVRLVGFERGELSVVVVHDDRMADLHETYQNVPGTTDVLTFNLSAGDDASPRAQGEIDAELVLCYDEARRQAGRLGHVVDRELLLYAVHGLLHLAGHDDHNDADAARMHRREDELLTAAGFGAVYARGLRDEQQLSQDGQTTGDRNASDSLPAASSVSTQRGRARD